MVYYVKEYTDGTFDLITYEEPPRFEVPFRKISKIEYELKLETMMLNQQLLEDSEV